MRSISDCRMLSVRRLAGGRLPASSTTSSSAPVMFVSGARSWWETSDTNSDFIRSSWRSSSFAVSSWAVAASRCRVRSATLASSDRLLCSRASPVAR